MQIQFLGSYWNGIVTGYIYSYEMFKPSLSKQMAQDHRLHWTYPCRKQIQGKKAYPSWPKI